MRFAYCDFDSELILRTETLLAIAGFGLTIEGVAIAPFQHQIRVKVSGNSLPSMCLGKTWVDAPIIEMWFTKNGADNLSYISNIRVRERVACGR